MIKEQHPSASDAGDIQKELDEQLERIREEEVPERLLELARQLQAHLRHRGTTGEK
ncbi:hypothetical protein [Celeribacter indicus]|uniref:hypothetical protein n=1 Tax=Celeribacter indicus TaxID=1208324 RepID=UPI00089833FF|nr:hypothetical protein [Celeribacter indicus]SDW44910.1 hypothetical protein SAMN05443573_103269 [Celeribacter indicus]